MAFDVSWDAFEGESQIFVLLGPCCGKSAEKASGLEETLHFHGIPDHFD